MPQSLTFNDIMQLERRQRADLMNYLSGFKSANLIGTTGPGSVPNLAIFNSVVHIGANPPYLGFILRPATVPRHTYENIKATGFYTINHIHEGIYQQAHQTSAKYGPEASEFDAVGLTPEFHNGFLAPYVAESHIKLGMKYQEEYLIKANDTIMVIGEVVEILLPKDSFTEDGYLNLSDYGTIAISGLDAYHKTERIARLSYARPGQQPREL